MRKSYEKISPTAKLVAYLRTFTDIPYAKEMALESGAKKTFQELAGESKDTYFRFAPFWEARYKVTDRILAEHDMTQVQGKGNRGKIDGKDITIVARNFGKQDP